MRVVVSGATGNLGVSLLRTLASDPSIEEVVGVARRIPAWGPEGVTWRAADIVTDDLAPVLTGADAVVHLAWLVQPSRDVGRLWEVNAHGSHRFLTAAAAAGITTIVHASSVGTYSPAHLSVETVDESWPTDGIGTSSYSRAKAYVERCLDAIESENTSIRVVRLRPALLFKHEAGDRVRRLFLGAVLPISVLEPGRLPFLPAVRGLRFQAVHTADVAEAFRLAITGRAGGAFNLAADPVLGFDDVAELLGTRAIGVPRWIMRPLVIATSAARLHPVDVGWFDMAVHVPTMDCSRARDVLGWRPRRDARMALAEILDGVRTRAGGPTRPLSAQHSRLTELTAGQGAEEVRD